MRHGSRNSWVCDLNYLRLTFVFCDYICGIGYLYINELRDSLNCFQIFCVDSCVKFFSWTFERNLFFVFYCQQYWLICYSTFVQPIYCMRFIYQQLIKIRIDHIAMNKKKATFRGCLVIAEKLSLTQTVFDFELNSFDFWRRKSV